MAKNFEIKLADEAHKSDVVKLVQSVFQKGETYPYSPDSTFEEVEDIWFEKDKRVYVGLINGDVVGTFFIKQNKPDLGGHVANAGFIINENYSGQGLGTKMGAFGLEEAKKLGFQAMQYNYVVETNIGSIKIWERLGFEKIGFVPECFNHKTEGLIGAYVMYKKL